jgi:hypothetical protein
MNPDAELALAHEPLLQQPSEVGTHAFVGGDRVLGSRFDE